MNRILNVTLISSLATIMACSPASRQQAIPKKDLSSQQKGTQQAQPTIDPVTGKVVQPQQGQSNPPHAESKTDPMTVGSLKISTVAFGMLKDGGVDLKIEVQDDDKKTLVPYTITVTSTGQTIPNDAITASQFLCDDGSNDKAPASCPNSTFLFTLKGQALSAKVTTVTDWVLDERFANSVKEATDGTSDNSTANYKTNVGVAQFHKVVLSYGAASIVGIHANFRLNGTNDQTPQDDDQISTDANIKVKVFGLPTVDLQNAAIVTEAAINNSSGVTSRQEELLAMLPKDSGDKFIRYSVPVFPSKDSPKGTAPSRILILTARSADTVVPEPITPTSDTPPAQPETPPTPPAPATPPADVPAPGAAAPAAAGSADHASAEPKANIFDELQDVEVTAEKMPVQDDSTGDATAVARPGQRDVSGDSGAASSAEHCSSISCYAHKAGTWLSDLGSEILQVIP